MGAKNLNLWISYICEQSVPVMKTTVQSILNICNNEQATCKDLADTIMKDPAFASRVIRIANCLYYNRTTTPIKDIRQAVLLVGFDKILAISLTVSIVDSLVNNNTMCHIKRLMMSSLQTALLSTAIAKTLKLHRPDDLFIAGLFYNFGEIAFWSLTGVSGDDIATQLEDMSINLPSEEAQQELLGVTFNELTIGLATRWQLSPILRMALLEPNIHDPYVQCLSQSHAVILEFGNNNYSLQGLQSLANWMKQPVGLVAELVQSHFEKAAELSSYYLPRAT